MQISAPGESLKKPGLHAMHASALSLPVSKLAVPAGQRMHASLLFAPMLGLYEPAWHGVKASAALAARSIAQYLRRNAARATGSLLSFARKR